MADYNAQDMDFEEITNFLAEYSWLFDFKLTRIFLDGVLDNMPKEWKKTLKNMSISELADLPFGKIKIEWPESLRNFIQMCVKFSLSREISASTQGLSLTSPVKKPQSREISASTLGLSLTSPADIDLEIKRGMTDKKLHEVCHMTSQIDHVTRKNGNDGVIDVGSGLGYLGQVLHCNYGHSVLGLEGKQGHTTGADKRTQKFENCHHLHNITCELSQQKQSQQEFLSLILDWFSKIKSTGTGCCHFQTGLRNFKSHDKNCQTSHDTMTSAHLTGGKIFENCENNCEKQTQQILTGSVSNFEQGQNICENRGNDNNKTDLQADVKTCTKFDAFDIVSGDDRKSSKQMIENSDDSENEVVSDKIDKSPTFCMVGLHCCGDLTPIMLHNFVELDHITSLCCVSCCYHRMNFNEHVQQHDNFPMSQQLKTSLIKTRHKHRDFKFSPYALRLAAQETRARWQEQTRADHDYHMKNVAYRGVFETCLNQVEGEETFQLKKNVRKLAHRGDYTSYLTYIDAVYKHVYTPDTASLEDTRTKFRGKMQANLEKYQNYFCLIEPLTALQYLLQPVLESFIYMDRKHWLLEQGLQAHIIPIFDEYISPRNLALIAWK